MRTETRRKGTSGQFISIYLSLFSRNSGSVVWRASCAATVWTATQSATDGWKEWVEHGVRELLSYAGEHTTLSRCLLTAPVAKRQSSKH